MYNQIKSKKKIYITLYRNFQTIKHKAKIQTTRTKKKLCLFWENFNTIFFFVHICLHGSVGTRYTLPCINKLHVIPIDHFNYKTNIFFSWYDTFSLKIWFTWLIICKYCIQICYDREHYNYNIFHREEKIFDSFI